MTLYQTLCGGLLRMALATLLVANLLLVSPFWTSLPAQAADPEADRLAVAGEAILTAQCARCHATTRSGDSPLAAAPAFRVLSRKYPLDSMAEALAEGITTGHPEMPEFIFSTEEIAAILEYIERISEPPAQ